MNDFSEKGADRRFNLPVQECQRQVQASFSRIKIVPAIKIVIYKKGINKR